MNLIEYRRQALHLKTTSNLHGMIEGRLIAAFNPANNIVHFYDDNGIPELIPTMYANGLNVEVEMKYDYGMLFRREEKIGGIGLQLFVAHYPIRLTDKYIRCEYTQGYDFVRYFDMTPPHVADASPLWIGRYIEALQYCKAFGDNLHATNNELEVLDDE